MRHKQKSDSMLMGQPTSLNAKAMKFWYTGNQCHKQTKQNKDSNKKTVEVSTLGTKTTA